MMLGIARQVMRLVNAGNWIAQVLFLAMLASLLIDIGPLPARLMARALPGQGARLRHLFDAALLLGPLLAVSVHIICVRAIAMIDTLAEGTPFVAANSRRLHDIGWALLALQILDLAYGGLSREMAAASGRNLPWSPALTGWIAVLLVRVFAAGARMHDEIEGPV